MLAMRWPVDGFPCFSSSSFHLFGPSRICVFFNLSLAVFGPGSESRACAKIAPPANRVEYVCKLGRLPACLPTHLPIYSCACGRQESGSPPHNSYI